MTAWVENPPNSNLSLSPTPLLAHRKTAESETLRTYAHAAFVLDIPDPVKENGLPQVTFGHLRNDISEPEGIYQGQPLRPSVRTGAPPLTQGRLWGAPTPNS